MAAMCPASCVLGGRGSDYSEKGGEKPEKPQTDGDDDSIGEGRDG